MIVPRWEWRSFGERLAAAERELAALGPARIEESDEIYLLSRRSDASVKLRGGRVDVKRRLQVDPDGLELWIPELKAEFPLSAEQVALVLSVLSVPVPELARPDYTLQQVAEEVIAPEPDLLTLRVHKTRAHHEFAGCRAERTELATPSGTTRTIAVEAEDPASVRAALAELGVASLPVVCVARGLKALAGFGAHRYAAIDVGTNSVKLHVGELGADGAWRDVLDRAEITRLGEGLDGTGRLADAAVARTVDAIAELAAEARRAGAEAIAAAGTAGLRSAPNGQDLIAGVRERCALTVEILPGEEEARLAYLAARDARGPVSGSLLVFDTGGGSSQFTFGRGELVDERFSLEVGSVRLTERFALDGVVPADRLAAAFADIIAGLAPLRGRSPPDAVIGMGGAVTNLVAVQLELADYDPAAVQGATLERREIDRQIELYRARPADARRGIAGLQPKRAEVILAGACIVRSVLALVGRDSLTVSDRGLRHGLLAARFASSSTVQSRIAASQHTNGGTRMSTLVAIAYPDAATAERVRGELIQATKEHLIDLEDAVVVEHQANGKIKLHQAMSTTGAGAASGALWGGLIGLIFLAPLFGMAIGAAAGGLGGKMADVGVNDGFMKELGNKMPPGGAALIALGRSDAPEKVIDRVKQYGGVVVQTSLDEEAEAHLKAALGETEPVS